MYLRLHRTIAIVIGVLLCVNARLIAVECNLGIKGEKKVVAAPEKKPVDSWEDASERLLIEPFIRFFDVSSHLRSVSDNRKEALNVNAFDEIGNSAWWIARNGYKNMPMAELKVGPCVEEGPDTSGTLLLYKTKDKGATFGFNVQDQKGQKYILKFDPPGYPELGTGAEMISTLILHAIGYNVPENFITAIDPEKIVIGEDVTFMRWNTETKMTKRDLDSMMANLNRLPNGKIRVLASKLIDGVPLGGWRYSGTFEKDPNDLIPHQHRREIRAFRVIGSWINYYDVALDNTLSMYNPVCKRVVHYYVDFNNTLGSYANGPRPPNLGYETNFSLFNVFKNMVFNSFSSPPWEKNYKVISPSIGSWDSKYYEPEKFKFIIPSIAFDNLTDRDGFWAAKLVMSFTDAQIDTVVNCAQYSSTYSSKYVAKILKERRDKVGKYYSENINPIDNVKINKSETGLYSLSFKDYGVAWGFDNPLKTTYDYWFYNRAGKQRKSSVTASNGLITINIDKKDITDTEKGKTAVFIETTRAGKKVGGPLIVLLNYEDEGSEMSLAGLHR